MFWLAEKAVQQKGRALRMSEIRYVVRGRAGEVFRLEGRVRAAGTGDQGLNVNVLTKYSVFMLWSWASTYA